MKKFITLHHPISGNLLTLLVTYTFTPAEAPTMEYPRGIAESFEIEDLVDGQSNSYTDYYTWTETEIIEAIKEQIDAN